MACCDWSHSHSIGTGGFVRLVRFYQTAHRPGRNLSIHSDADCLDFFGRPGDFCTGNGFGRALASQNRAAANDGGGFFGSTFWAQFFFIGIVAGAGIGLAYVVPIAVGVKWFPDKKGMITGLAVAGFGFGATIWVKLAGSWFGGLLNSADVFGLPPVQSVFLIYGVVFAILVLLGSMVMVNPPEDYKPGGWEPADEQAVAHMGGEEFSPRRMMRTPQFYAIWLVFASSAIAGLMIIYCIQLFGMDALEYHGVENAIVITGTAMAWYAIFNGLGRILWGMISDHIGRKAAIIAMSTLQGIIMLSLYHGFINFGLATGLVIGASFVGFNYGGIFALFPAITADYFGNKAVGRNYGWIFTAYGMAGITGPLLPKSTAGTLPEKKDRFGPKLVLRKA